MKISIKTKYDVTEVDADEVLHLVVPCKFTRARIVSKTKPRAKMHQVQFWCKKEHRVRGISFATLEDANEFMKTVTYDGDVTRDVTFGEAFKEKENFQKFYRLRQVAIDYPHRDVPVSGFFLGLWLGDGVSVKCAVATADEEIKDYLRGVAESIDHQLVYEGHYVWRIAPKEGDTANKKTPDKDMLEKALQDLKDGVMTKDIIKKYNTGWKTLNKFKSLKEAGTFDEYFARRKINPISRGLKELGVWGNKHIPELYLKNSREIRMQVLAGVIDSDGHMLNGGYNMAFASWRLLEDVRTLASSLGFLCSPIMKGRHCHTRDECPKMHTFFRSRISGGPGLHEVPVLLPRKKIDSRTQRFDQLEFELSSI
jgi:replicative DNA helicase